MKAKIKARIKTTKRILFIIAVVAAIVALSSIISSSFGKQHDESDVGRKVSIRWEMVNLREDYSTASGVITKLHQGETVFLTGNSYSYIGGNGHSTEDWIEVQQSGKTGWIVSSAIQWH